MGFLKFIKKFIFLLPILCVIIGFNYFVDPANIFRSEEYYKEIVGFLLMGKNVANITNYNERLLQKYFIGGLSKRKEIVVLGSSRIMQFNSFMFPGRSFINNGVSGASIEDDIAIYWMHRKKGFIPSIVVIGLDPWLLNKNNGQSRYVSLLREYQEASIDILGQNNGFQEFNLFPTKYFELFSPSYFQASFWYLLQGFREKKKDMGHFYPTSKNITNEPLKRADGSIGYDIKLRSVTLADARLSALEYARQDTVYSLGNFTKIDPRLADEFNRFVGLLLKDKVQIIFFLPPYHPETYAILAKSDKYKIIVDVQKYFEKYAGSHKIKILGSYDPNDCFLKGSDFYDGMHQKIESIQKTFDFYELQKSEKARFWPK